MVQFLGIIIHRYTPDFLVFRGNHHILVECKPLKLTTLDENRIKFEAAQAWCAVQGWSFQIVTDMSLHSGYRLRNIQLLTQFARHTIEPGLKSRIHASLKGVSLRTVGDVMTSVTPQSPQSSLIPILHMAFYHELVLPLNDAPITVASLVMLPPEREEEIYER